MTVLQDDSSASKNGLPKLCQRCGRPVTVGADMYETFERMHYVCFHYEFEHDPVDPDEECGAGGCPSAVVHPRPDRRH